MSDSDSDLLPRRLALLGIDDDTRHNIALFLPLFQAHIDEIIERFYDRLLNMPEGRKAFGDGSIVGTLKKRQRAHWTRLFSCNFDAGFAQGALAVGEAHFRHRISPQLYIASYNFFLSELIRVAAQYCKGTFDLTAVLTSITKLVHLDMDLALSAYTREYWRPKAAAAGHKPSAAAEPAG